MKIREMVAEEKRLMDRLDFFETLDVAPYTQGDDGHWVMVLEEPALCANLRAVLECHRNQVCEELNEIRARIDTLEPEKEIAEHE